MGFDWGGIVIAVLAGLLGAAVGGTIGAIFSPGKFRRYIALSFAVVGLVAGIANIRPNIEARFGEQIRQSLGPDAMTQALRSDDEDAPGFGVTKLKFAPLYRHVKPVYENLSENVVLERIFRDAPDLADGARFRLNRAYKTGGRDALDAEAAKLERELRQYAESSYIPRATDENVLDYMLVMSGAARHMGERDPHLCFTWLYGPARGIRVDLDALIETMGEEKYQETQASLGKAIKEALNSVPDFDQERGQIIVRAAMTTMVDNFDDGTLEILRGNGAPSTDEQALALCNGVAVLYETIATNPPAQAAAGYRFLLSQSQ